MPSIPAKRPGALVVRRNSFSGRQSETVNDRLELDDCLWPIPIIQMQNCCGYGDSLGGPARHPASEKLPSFLPGAAISGSPSFKVTLDCMAGGCAYRELPAPRTASPAATPSSRHSLRPSSRLEHQPTKRGDRGNPQGTCLLALHHAAPYCPRLPRTSPKPRIRHTHARRH